MSVAKHYGKCSKMLVFLRKKGRKMVQIVQSSYPAEVRK